MIQREDQDREVMLGIGENTSFVKKLLARDDDFGDSVELKNGRDPGVGFAFAWNISQGFLGLMLMPPTIHCILLF